ncbi:hypothetical protein [Acidithiobacillus sp.]|jgi:hypothetical protein|uniref:hypothetical protein n=1 Tax=Acidithiobacillus sp. TaxID=1872118 RepID=UPI0031FE97B6
MAVAMAVVVAVADRKAVAGKVVVPLAVGAVKATVAAGQAVPAMRLVAVAAMRHLVVAKNKATWHRCLDKLVCTCENKDFCDDNSSNETKRNI